MLDNFNVLLGSQSPRRKELLEKMGVNFSLIHHPIEEIFPEKINSFQVAEFLANMKSKNFKLSEKELLITADTTVIFNDTILNKPKDKDEAYKMLSTLSNKTHNVVTGVCIRSNEKCKSFSENTTVKFKVLSDQEINHYLNLGTFNDKAGSYGIQEWIGIIGIEYINGCYYNVMGLPTTKLMERLKSF